MKILQVNSQIYISLCYEIMFVNIDNIGPCTWALILDVENELEGVIKWLLISGSKVNDDKKDICIYNCNYTHESKQCYN